MKSQEIILTQKNRIKPKSETYRLLQALAFHTARLYNVGLYSVRQYYFLNNEYLPYSKNYHVCKNNEHYKILLSDHAQQVLRLVDRDMRSFFNLLKAKSKGKYSGKIGLPKYKKKDGLMTISIQGRSARIKNGYVHVGFSKMFKEKYNPKIKELKFKLPKHIKVDKLQELRIIPKFNGREFEIEFVYKKVVEYKELNHNRYLSIDLGLNNFIAAYSSDGANFLIDGRYIKSVNHHYNKTMAKLKAIYDRQGYKNTKKLIKLSNKRQHLLNEYFNKVVNYITSYCVKHDIGNIVIGDFANIKQSISLGKKNNQNFVMVPYGKFKQKLESKCKQLGINFIQQDESYTSKASFYDMEEPTKHESYIGKRVHRGLFITKDGYKVNADINASANILVKYFKSNGLDTEALYLTRYGCVNHPVRLRLNQHTSKPHALACGS